MWRSDRHPSRRSPAFNSERDFPPTPPACDDESANRKDADPPGSGPLGREAPFGRKHTGKSP